MIIDDSFDQDWSVRGNLGSIRSSDQEKLVFTRQKESLAALLLETAFSANLELRDSHLQRLQKIPKLLRVKSRSGL